MTKKLLTRILVALFAFSLICGIAGAQAAKKPAKATTAAAANADLLDINSATKEQLEALPVSEPHTRRKSSTAVLTRRRPTC